MATYIRMPWRPLCITTRSMMGDKNNTDTALLVARGRRKGSRQPNTRCRSICVSNAREPNYPPRRMQSNLGQPQGKIALADGSQRLTQLSTNSRAYKTVCRVTPKMHYGNTTDYTAITPKRGRSQRTRIYMSCDATLLRITYVQTGAT